MKDTLKLLLQSRKTLIAITSIVMAGIFAAVQPEQAATAFEFIKTIVLMWLGTIASEDVAAKLGKGTVAGTAANILAKIPDDPPVDVSSAPSQ
jgi:hypothetical protein